MITIHLIYDTDALLNGWAVDLEATVPANVPIDEFTERVQYNVAIPGEIIEELKSHIEKSDNQCEAANRARCLRNDLRENAGGLYQYDEPRLSDITAPFASGDPLGSDNPVDRLLVGYAIQLCENGDAAAFVLTGDAGVAADLFVVRKQMHLDVHPLKLDHNDECAKLLHHLAAQHCDDLVARELRTKDRVQEAQDAIFREELESAVNHIRSVRNDNLHHRKLLLFSDVNHDVETQCEFLETLFAMGDKQMFLRPNLSFMLDKWRFSKEVTETLTDLLASPYADPKYDYVNTLISRTGPKDNEELERLHYAAPYLLRLEVFYGWRYAGESAAPNGFAMTFAKEHANRLLWAINLKCASLRELRMNKIEHRPFLGWALPAPPKEFDDWLSRVRTAFVGPKIGYRADELVPLA